MYPVFSVSLENNSIDMISIDNRIVDKLLDGNFILLLNKFFLKITELYVCIIKLINTLNKN